MPRNKPAATVVPPPERQPLSHIVESLAPRARPQKDMSGKYRMIHGSVFIPVPESDRLRADGSLDESKPRQKRATIHVVLDANGDPEMQTYKDDRGSVVTRPKYVGDVLWLNHDDAVRMLASDMVEPLDATPSRCGKVFAPPKEAKNWAGNAEAAQQHAAPAR